MRQKNILVFFILFLYISLSYTLSQAESPLCAVNAQINSINIKVNGRNVYYDNILYNDTTYLPLSQVMYGTGWYDAPQMASIPEGCDLSGCDLLFGEYDSSNLIIDYFLENLLQGPVRPAPSFGNPQARPIVLLGDSLTEGMSVFENFQGWNVLNMGVNGNTTVQMLARIGDVVLCNPQKLFIMAGTNDLWAGQDIKETLKYYNMMLTIIQKKVNDCEIYVQSTMPFGKSALDRNPVISNDNVKLLNSFLQRIAGAKGINYLDIASVYTDDSGLFSSMHTIDGIHFVPSSYDKWVNILKNLFAASLRKPETLKIQPGYTDLALDGRHIFTTCFIYNDELYIPLRAIASLGGMKVYWEDSSNTAYLYSDINK